MLRRSTDQVSVGGLEVALKQLVMIALKQLVMIVVAFGAACDPSGGGPECNVGADCVSGVCASSGRCVSLDGGLDADLDATPAPDAEDASDAGADALSLDASVDGGGVCSPNRDGRIERSEVPLRAGLRATFATNTDVDFDTSGTMVDGVRTWDLSAFPGDEMALIETRDPSGAWFADDFAGATYATELSVQEELLGVFAVDDDALSLRGVVSPEDGFLATNLEYDPAVQVLRFPLEAGQTWTTDASVSGLASGVASFYSEEYRSEVDATGQLIAPFGTFDVLRVRTELVRTVGLLETTTVSFAFVSECFGTVATLTGVAGDDRPEVTRLAEVRRLAP